MFSAARVTALWPRPYEISIELFSIHTVSPPAGTPEADQLAASDQNFGPVAAVTVARVRVPLTDTFDTETVKRTPLVFPVKVTTEAATLAVASPPISLSWSP